MFKFIIWAFVLLMVFRFIFKFVLPILHITRSAQDRIKEMQDQMQEMQNRQAPPKQTINNNARPKDGDYIEYEEVK